MSSSRRRLTSVIAATTVIVAGLGAAVAGPGEAVSSGVAPVAKAAKAKPGKALTDKAVFFASDGMRQDKVERYAAQGVMPTMRQLLKKGVKAANHGLLTQAPPNTGAGWYTLATGAWPGVHGSTNNTFHKNGDPFGNRTAAFDNGVLQAESIAQAAERDGLKVAQVEWAGGRNASIQGPTIDFRTFLSGRGVATNYISPADSANFVAAFGLQFDHPAGFSNQPAFPQAAPVPATGWTAVPTSFSPAMEMRLRVIDFGVDKYGLNAYLYDSTDDGTTNYDRVLFSTTKDGADSVGDLAEGEWADVKVTVQDGPLAGKTAGMLVKVETLNDDLTQVRLFHTSVTRAIASWPTWPGEPGYTEFDEYLAVEFPTSTAADFAVLEAGIVSEDTYVEQGMYWSTAHWPMLEYVADVYDPDLLMVGMPTTDEFQHQFLGLVSPTLPNGDPSPAYDDVNLDGVKDGLVAKRRGYIRDAYHESDQTLKLARSLMGRDPTTFIGSDHGFAPQFLAIDASKVLVDLGLLSHPQTSNCRPATGETIGKAKACFAGGAVQIYLNVAGRDPVNPAFTQVPAAEEAATVAAVKAAFLALTDPNDWTGDGQPEGWKVIDRAYTKAEARYIPNGPGSTADMAHPTRTGDLVAFSYPPYQFDAATPGTLIAPSAFFGQHGYVPDVQDLDNDINMRATFIAGGKGVSRGTIKASSIDLAPTLAFMLGIPTPQHSQGKVLLKAVDGGTRYDRVNIVGLNDFHGQLDPTTATIDGRAVPVGGAAFLGTLFDEEAAGLPGRELILAGGDNVGASPPNSALLEDRPAIDVENAWGLDATSYGNHEFDFGLERLLAHQARANFPFLATNIVDEDTGRTPPWVTPSKVFTVNGIKVGVIGAELESTPELVRAGATEGLDVPRRGTPDQGGVRTPAQAWGEGSGRGDPRGHLAWREPDRQHAGCGVGGADHRDRRRAPEHHRRRDGRRAHPPRVEPDARPHPDHRGRQRRGVVLRAPAAGEGRRRGLGGRFDPARQEPRPRPACRRPGDHPGRQRRDGAAAQPGGRLAVRGHHARPDAVERVGDGQLRGRRHAGQVRRRRRLHELGRPARRPPRDPTVVRRRGARRDHVGRGVRGTALRQRHGADHPHGGPAADGVRERLLAGLQLGDQHRAVPGCLRAPGDVHVHRDHGHRDGDVEDAGRHRRAGDPDRADRHRQDRDQRLHADRRRRLHRLHPGDGRRAERRAAPRRGHRPHRGQLPGLGCRRGQAGQAVAVTTGGPAPR